MRRKSHSLNVSLVIGALCAAEKGGRTVHELCADHMVGKKSWVSIQSDDMLYRMGGGVGLLKIWQVPKIQGQDSIGERGGMTCRLSSLCAANDIATSSLH